MNFEEACALAGNGGLLLIRDVWCPTHGRAHPEGMAFPFTSTAECLAFQFPSCPLSYCEEDLLIDAQLTDTPSHAHWAMVERDELGPRVVIELRPVPADLKASILADGAVGVRPGADKVWAHGSRVVGGVLIDDHPSGAAVQIEA